jgi:hypothetical protein
MSRKKKDLTTTPWKSAAGQADTKYTKVSFVYFVFYGLGIFTSFL